MQGWAQYHDSSHLIKPGIKRGISLKDLCDQACVAFRLEDKKFLDQLSSQQKVALEWGMVEHRIRFMIQVMGYMTKPPAI
jgi:hypothetical protein